jgi:hypothetical protein
MRAYLPISHADLSNFLTSQSLQAKEVFAATDFYINENLDCDEEEIEYLLSVSAGEKALELRSSMTAPGLVLAIELEDSQCGQSVENVLTLMAPLTWSQVQCALLIYPDDDELVWFATQEIAPELVNWI